MRNNSKATSKCMFVALFIMLLLMLMTGNINAATQLEVATYVRDNIVEGGDLTGKTLWMTDAAYGGTYEARDIDGTFIPFPYDNTWLVMIDDAPSANWGHPCRWVFVNDDLSEHLDIDKYFPPTVSPSVDFGCVDLTSIGADDCPLYILPPSISGPIGTDKDCLYAVLISGGWNNGSNYNRYPNNLSRMYKMLRACGYPKSNIYVYYDNGTSLDLDDVDNDGNHSTGNDVDGAVNEATIRSTIQLLCTILDPEVDILFIYTTNHGIDNEGIALWDFDSDGFSDANEVYSPSELSSDTENCSVCRLFMILDQCFSGEFLAMATDGNHANSAIYVAATGAECSYGSEYLDAWDNNDPGSTDLDDMHPTTLPNSTPGSAMGTAGNADMSLCECCVKPNSYTNKHFHQGLGDEYSVENFELVLMGEKRIAGHYDGYPEQWHFTSFDWWINEQNNTVLRWWDPYGPDGTPGPIPYCNWVHVGWILDEPARVIEANWTDIYWDPYPGNIGLIKEVGHGIFPGLESDVVLTLNYDIETSDPVTISNIYYLILEDSLPLDALKPSNPLLDPTSSDFAMVELEMVPLDLASGSSISLAIPEPVQSGDWIVYRFEGSGQGEDNEFIDICQQEVEVTESIPTLSEWGLIVLALLILAIGTATVIRRRKAVAINQ